jgi:hypothetical protein
VERVWKFIPKIADVPTWRVPEWSRPSISLTQRCADEDAAATTERATVEAALTHVAAGVNRLAAPASCWLLPPPMWPSRSAPCVPRRRDSPCGAGDHPRARQYFLQAGVQFQLGDLDRAEDVAHWSHNGPSLMAHPGNGR